MTQELPRQPEPIPQQPIPPAPVEEPITVAPAPQAEPTPKKAKRRKLLPLILVAVAVIVVVVLIIAFAGGKNNGQSAAIAPATPQQAEDVGEAPQQETTPEEAPEDDVIPVSLGGCIDNENFTMTFDSMDLYDEYSFRTSEYSSTSLFVEDGYKVLVVQGHFTNNSTGTISDSAFNLKASVNDKYTAEGYDVRISFIRSNTFEIDAYTDVDYVLYVNVPEKIAAEFETATFTIGWKNDMSIPVTVYNVDGTQTVELDQRYALTAGPGAAESAEAIPEEEYNWISLGQTIYTNDYEFTLLNVEMTYEVLPPNTSSVYSSYAAESGKVFVHVEADVKNIMQRDIRIDELFTAGAYYDWKYPYEGQTVVNDGDNRFDWVGSYVAATPLETCRAHSIIECPVEVDTSGNSVMVNIQIGDETYYYTLR